MAVKKDLEAALKDAMRANDAVRKSTLRVALTAIKEAEVQKMGELDDPAILAILQKEVRARQEALAEAEKANRQDLVENAKAEMKVLEGFLPKGLSEQELEAIVQAAIAEIGASTPADMGKVMKAVLPKVQGRADGGQVSQLVRSRLQG
ncbi:MAG TPA: GatB/YqeY domain-containing protein [Anaerolineales bacterium]|nr:GatB/YqeY domain-containing protein [Anaerolineales bacterium]